MNNTDFSVEHTRRNAGREEKTPLPVLALTCGDPNGVGYEILLKAVADPHIATICTPLLYGNLQAARKHLLTLDNELHSLSIQVVERAEAVRPGRINLLNCYPDSVTVDFGKNTKDAGRASLAALERASADLRAGHVHALVTAPINKENIQSEAFTFSGHTEYLTHHFGKGRDALMMMVSGHMRVALVCNHVPLRRVPEFVTEERILSKLTVLTDTLRNDFLISKPRIAVLALNPHAGDNGLLGTEEREIIRPAVEKAVAAGMQVFGPYSADGFFGAGRYRQFDAVLAMYHDQGLIPFKSLDMEGVNFTAGLDIIRTSPDHGTAYELAGRNKAATESMRNALYLALDLLKTRAIRRTLLASALIIPEPAPQSTARPAASVAQPTATPAESVPQSTAEPTESAPQPAGQSSQPS